MTESRNIINQSPTKSVSDTLSPMNSARRVNSPEKMDSRVKPST